MIVSDKRRLEIAHETIAHIVKILKIEKGNTKPGKLHPEVCRELSSKIGDIRNNASKTK